MLQQNRGLSSSVSQVTDVPFPIYFWATLIGVSPATLLDSYIGSLFSSLGE